MDTQKDLLDILDKDGLQAAKTAFAERLEQHIETLSANIEQPVNEIEKDPYSAMKQLAAKYVEKLKEEKQTEGGKPLTGEDIVDQFQLHLENMKSEMKDQDPATQEMNPKDIARQAKMDLEEIKSKLNAIQIPTSEESREDQSIATIKNLITNFEEVVQQYKLKIDPKFDQGSKAKRVLLGKVKDHGTAAKESIVKAIQEQIDQIEARIEKGELNSAQKEAGESGRDALKSIFEVIESLVILDDPEEQQEITQVLVELVEKYYNTLDQVNDEIVALELSPASIEDPNSEQYVMKELTEDPQKVINELKDALEQNIGSLNWTITEENVNPLLKAIAKRSLNAVKRNLARLNHIPVPKSSEAREITSKALKEVKEEVKKVINHHIQMLPTYRANIYPPKGWKRDGPMYEALAEYGLEAKPELEDKVRQSKAIIEATMNQEEVNIAQKEIGRSAQSMLDYTRWRLDQVESTLNEYTKSELAEVLQAFLDEMAILLLRCFEGMHSLTISPNHPVPTEPQFTYLYDAVGDYDSKLNIKVHEAIVLQHRIIKEKLTTTKGINNAQKVMIQYALETFSALEKRILGFPINWNWRSSEQESIFKQAIREVIDELGYVVEQFDKKFNQFKSIVEVPKDFQGKGSLYEELENYGPESVTKVATTIRNQIEVIKGEITREGISPSEKEASENVISEMEMILKKVESLPITEFRMTDEGHKLFLMTFVDEFSFIMDRVKPQV